LFGCTNQEKNLIKQNIDSSEMDNLYDFVNAEICQFPKEEFDSIFEIIFLDVTNDGFDDAILVNNIMYKIVTVKDNHYEIIKTDIPFSSYKNEFQMQNNFLRIDQSGGGTGVCKEYMSLLKYDNGKMITVLENLELSYYESFPPDWYCEHTGQINGPLDDFEYTLDCNDNGEIYTVKRYYTYNNDTLSFDENLVDEK